MSRVAFLTDRFPAMRAFYVDRLGCAEVAAWERPGARGCILDLAGLRIELLDLAREKDQPTPLPPAGRAHLVATVTDLEAAQQRIANAPPIEQTSWNARLFTVRDPDGNPVTFLATEP